MDALDIKRHLSNAASVCSHTLEVRFHISTLDVADKDEEICYGIFEPVPKQYSYGVIRKFKTEVEATSHYQSLKENNPNPIYVIKPDGHLSQNNEGGVYMVKYSRLFEKLEHWLDNFQKKNRSDDDLYRILSKLGPALEYRYKETRSIGDILKDTVITDDEQVFFWNWAPQSRIFKTEIGVLLKFIVEIKKLLKNPNRLKAFEDFITRLLLPPGVADPNDDLQLWVFNYPVFMTKRKGVRFLEALHKLVADYTCGVKQNRYFMSALSNYDSSWKNKVSPNSVLNAVLIYRRGYRHKGHDLPRFAYNCVKHYTQCARNLGMVYVLTLRSYNFCINSDPNIYNH